MALYARWRPGCLAFPLDEFALEGTRILIQDPMPPPHVGVTHADLYGFVGGSVGEGTLRNSFLFRGWSTNALGFGVLRYWT